MIVTDGHTAGVAGSRTSSRRRSKSSRKAAAANGERPGTRAATSATLCPREEDKPATRQTPVAFRRNTVSGRDENSMPPVVLAITSTLGARQ